MKEYNVKLDAKLIQMKTSYFQQKEQKIELEAQKRAAAEMSLKEKTQAEEQRAQIESKLIYWKE